MQPINFISFCNQALRGGLILIFWRLRWNEINKAKYLKLDDKVRVLCVHGFRMNGSCFQGLQAKLHKEGISSLSVDLGKPFDPISKYVYALKSSIVELINASKDQKIVIVAHSMGGLVTRLTLQKHPELSQNISKIITLGTPHYGTAILSFYTNTWTRRLFHPASPYLLKLPTILDLAPQINATSIASSHDFIVYPKKNALLKGTKHIELDNYSHVGLLTENLPQNIVIDELLQTESIETV